ncbi:TIM barrel protein [Lactococcus cremoris]|uniref:sugar phosphate isomerase/epimerase family protein n=1 Tax=Lactococcus lactis subsp. cremoris TaxID=1359 RepID=UPI0028728684|nr:TIM barrel protein [Lactococcus cremoris]MDR9868221.1 TIM barrel protein [Lactococcus cremoris]
MGKIKTAVSLYSLQDEYLNKRMSLEDIIHFVKDNGAEGIEILPDQMIKNAPTPSLDDIESFKALVKETGLGLACDDVFLNTNLYKNRTLTHRESIDLLIQEIKQAHALGFKLIRLVSMVPYWVCEPLLPYCEKYDVAIAIEIHAGMAFDEPMTKDFIDEAKRLNSPYIGIVVDTGIFCRKFPRVVRQYEINNGATSGMFDYLDSLFEKGTDLHREMLKNGGKFPQEFIDAQTSEEDHFFSYLCDGYENYDLSVLDEVLPLVKHFHFKTFEMTDEGPEYSIDYKGLLQYLHDHDYDGYVATEYEGNRFILPGTPMLEKQNVSRQLKYLNEVLKEIQG